MFLLVFISVGMDLEPTVFYFKTELLLLLFLSGILFLYILNDLLF